MLNLDNFRTLSKYRENDTSAGYGDALKECFGEACKAIFAELSFSAGHLIINYQPEESDDRLTYTTENAAQESRACFLFKEYQGYINDRKSKDRKFTPYFIHDHFKDQHSLVCVSLEKGDPISIKYHTENDVSVLDDNNLNDGAFGKHEYKEFVDVMFNAEGKASEFRQRVSTERNSPFAFICFNLSIPYFSYMGSVMFEITEENFDTNKFIEEMKAKVVHIREALMVVKRIEYDYINKRNLQKIKLEAIKSAMAAIMSRNMSHNLGSHYLYYTKTHLEKLASKGGDLGPDIRGAARVLGYMQARMDYLSTMISNDRYSYAGVNFKSQIYDELTIDDFSKRHFYNELSDTEWYEKKNKEVIELDCSLRTYLQELTGGTKEEKIKEKRDRIKHLKQDVVKKLNLLDGVVKNNRTTNFLLTNLIYSENFSRMDIMDRMVDGTLNQLKLCVRYKGKGSKYAIFTGEAGVENEETLKSTLSMMNVALPGGVMSCHAFFNVLENFIRNSAKYLQEDFVEEDGCKLLKITIAIEETMDEDGSEYYIFNIYDNKANARKSVQSSLYDNLTERLKSLVILDDVNGLDKSDKGFKEMLFSSTWLRSYVFNNESINGEVVTCADIITRIQNAAPDERIAMIEDYAFKLIAVNEDVDNETIAVYDRETINACSTTSLNLGVSLKLPKFNRIFVLKNMSGSLNEVMNRCLNVYGDIVLYDPDEISTSQTEIVPMRWFPRALQVKSPKSDSNVANDIKIFEQILKNRFEGYENYVLCFDDLKEKDIEVSNKFRIYLQRHLSSQEDLNRFKSYEYADSVSGGNFTITLAEWFKEWYNRGRKKDEIMYYQILKIKESALTRITMIDERIHKDMQTKGTDAELACKNIRVLNYKEDIPNASLDDLMSIFVGNSFKDGTNKTHFLSIHLGLIEKIVQNDVLFENITCEGTIEARTEYLMNRIKDVFGNDAFISVHSGRGNFSKDLSSSLVDYPFIGLASLESAYNNSKYLLSQLFYNTVYIGKGRLNKENHGKE